MVSYRTPLARARGLGSAKSGAGHWIVERVTSVALVPLSLWAVCSGLSLAKVGYDGRTGKVTVNFSNTGAKELCQGQC